MKWRIVVVIVSQILIIDIMLLSFKDKFDSAKFNCCHRYHQKIQIWLNRVAFLFTIGHNNNIYLYFFNHFLELADVAEATTSAKTTFKRNIVIIGLIS